MTRLGSILLSLLAAPAWLSAQDAAPPALGAPFLAELAVGPGILSGTRAFPLGLGAYLAASWVGVRQQHGYRLGVMATAADIGGPLPSDLSRGMVRSRTIAAFTLERIRLRQRGNLVVTTGYGLGVGSILYMVDQSRSGDESQYGNVQSATLAVSGSVDVAFRVPPGTPYVEGGPLDFYVGMRSALLFGAPAVGRTVPSTGEIPTSRGLGSTMQLLFGIRFGFFSEWFPSRL